MNRERKTAIFLIASMLLILASIFFGVLLRGRMTVHMTDFEVHGIDVSHHQKYINWNNVKAESIDFVFMKATEGKHFRDPMFTYNWQSAKEQNIARGAYHFYRPSVYSHIQAAHFIRTVQLSPGDLPPVLDLEKSDNRSKAIIIKGVRNWLNIIESHYGVKPIIYVNKDWYRKYIAGNFDDYVVWIAAYTTYPRPRLSDGKQWDFWQYTDRGQIDGINGKVDLNVFSGSKQDFQQFLMQQR